MQISCVEFHTKRTVNVEGKSTNLFTPLSTIVAARYSWNSRTGLQVDLKNGLLLIAMAQTNGHGLHIRRSFLLLKEYLKFCLYLKMNTASVAAEM